MTKLFTTLFTTLFLIMLPFSVFAEDPAPESGSVGDFAYYPIEPDIITNYLNEDKKHLGYVRVAVELMLDSSGDLSTVEHHVPLIRDAIIRILGEQDIRQIKSLKGREEIRAYCLEVANNLMVQEEGKKLLKDILFTKYLYQ